ncbi:MAG: hydrogenase maturation nickel metallochaperone HypA [Thermodesulfobacteriota bacterium]|nr:hydrogenase maturation nickel metallochaperone HypA [Thermodesulfobacteriota bacterium]
MHELPITESILNIVLKHAKANNVNKVLSVSLKIGELSDLINEWVQRYFDYLSKDTIAEGARLNIERTPVVVQCKECGHSFQVNIKESAKPRCPECGGDEVTLVSGREFYINSIEVI